jgi:transcriptional regulator with XRE-family HTH domain
MTDVKPKESCFIAAHSRAARGLLDITQEQLAAAAGVDVETIRRFERGDQRPYQTTLAKIREALERRGIEFTNGGSPGVRLRPENSIIQ